MRQWTRFFLAILLILCLSACGALEQTELPPMGVEEETSTIPQTLPSEPEEVSLPEDSSSPEEPEESEDLQLDPEGYYYDLENVVLYLYTYDELPPNYLTKAEARELGWEGGSVEYYLEGAAIGGDRFGNREGLLPEEPGRQYTECDLNTDGQSSRGAERLIFSNDGLYFYTADHYESFSQVWVEEGAVVME